jgi:cytochrome c-type biogenesis protein
MEVTAQKATSSGQVITQETVSRRNVVVHALMFIAGFSFIFVLLGATAGLLFGSFIQRDFVDIMITIGGILLIIMGIHMSGILKWIITKLNSQPSVQKPIKLIDRKLDELILPERRMQAGYGQSPGLIRSGIVGMTFAAGWTPCVGPLLGAILSLALNASRGGDTAGVIFQSAILLFTYSMGLAIPFLLSALVLTSATGVLRRINRHAHTIEIISAIFLIGVGILLLFGSVSELNRYFNQAPEWLYNIEDSLSQGPGRITLPLAFVAGLLSFASPCVLPLIPVYLGYLTGVAVSSHTTAK